MTINIFIALFVNLFNVFNINLIAPISETYDEPIANFEPNDNEDAAYDLLDSSSGLIDGNYYELDSYSFSINEKLSMDFGFEDNDYYYITVLTDSYIQMTVNIEEEYLYDFVVFKLNYELTDEGELYQTREYLYQDYTDSCCKDYEFYATPGTYFIILRGEQGMNSTYEIFYELEISSQKTLDSANANIGDMMYNKNLLGAMWVSDYLPINLGSGTMLNIYDTITYYLEANNNLTTRDHALDDLRAIANGQPIHLASYYLWDPYLRYVFYLVVDAFRDQLKADLDEEKEISEKYTLMYECTSIGLSTISIVSKNIPIKSIGIPTFVLSKVSQFALNFLFDMVVPKAEYDDAFYLSFLEKLATSLNIELGEYNGEELTEEFICNYIANYRYEDSLVEIPIYYKLIIDSSYVSNYDKYCVSFYEGACGIYNNKEEFYYNGNYIFSATNENNYYCRGKIYGIQTYDVDFSFDSLDLVENIEDIPRVAESVICNITKSIPQIPKGDYLWFSFSVPTTGEYYFLCKGDGNTNLKIELFTNLAVGYSNSGCILSNVGGYESSIDNEEGSYFRVKLNAGDVIYIRISGANYSKVANSSTLIISMNPAAGAEHIHYYGDPIYYDGSNHIYYCDCDEVILEKHVVKNGSNICVICGAKIDKGIIQW